METCPTQAVLPLVGLAADRVIGVRYNGGPGPDASGWWQARRSLRFAGRGDWLCPKTVGVG
ncbi:MAG: hypothetical protein ACQESR_12875 [Planctomycetota bacterium]